MQTAIDAARKIRRVYPDASAVEGRIYREEGFTDDAIASFRRAMELDPAGYKAALENALSAPATAAYRKVMEDTAFAQQLPR